MGTGKKVNQPVWRRAIKALVITLVVFELIWVIGANWALSSGFVKEKINKRPQKLLVEWSSARTWAPIWITLEGISVRTQSRKQQIYGTLDKVSLHASLLSLANKTVKIYDLDASGVDFRMRKRDLSGAEGAEPTADAEDEPEDVSGSSAAPTTVEGELTAGAPRAEVYLPEIPGLDPETLIDDPNRAAKKKKNKSPWTLQFDDVHLSDIEQIWIEANRLTGEGTIDAEFRLETRGGPMAIDRAHLDLQEIDLSVLGFEVGQGLDLEIEGSMDSHRSKEYKGLEILKVVSASMAISGRTTSVGLINLLLSKIEALSVKSTGGQVDGLVKLDHGVLQTGTRFKIDIEKGWVNIVDWRAHGAITIETAVEGGDEGLDTAVGVSLAEVELLGTESDDPLLEGAALELAATAEPLDLSGGKRSIADSLLTASLDLRNAHVADITRFPIPEIPGLSLTSGDVVVETSAAISREGGRTRMVVGGQGIGASYEEVSMKGDLAIELDIVASDGTFRNFSFNESFVRIDNVKVSEAMEETDDWYLHLDISEGEAEITGPTTLSTRVDLAMRDTAPLVALIAREKSTLAKLKGLLEFKDVKGEARLQMGNGILQFEDVDLRSKGLQIEADLRLGGERPNGVLWTKFHGIPLAVDLRGEKTKVHPIKPRKWYDAQTDPWTTPPKESSEDE